MAWPLINSQLRFMLRCKGSEPIECILKGDSEEHARLSAVLSSNDRILLALNDVQVESRPGQGRRPVTDKKMLVCANGFNIKYTASAGEYKDQAVIYTWNGEGPSATLTCACR
jgi:hypothetical protein